MRRVLVVLSSVVLWGCTSTMAPVDSGTPDSGMEEVEYEGPGAENPPDFSGDLIDAGAKSTIEVDAGSVVVDNRCCKLSFHLDTGSEPVDSVATLVGEVAPLSPGIPLTRVDGGYVANACFPMAASTFYFYQFEYTTGDAGSGGLDQGDGGYLVTLHRYSPAELNYSRDGERQNFIPSVTDCAQLDAGQGP